MVRRSWYIATSFSLLGTDFALDFDCYDHVDIPPRLSSTVSSLDDGISLLTASWPMIKTIFCMYRYSYSNLQNVYPAVCSSSLLLHTHAQSCNWGRGLRAWRRGAARQQLMCMWHAHYYISTCAIRIDAMRQRCMLIMLILAGRNCCHTHNR